MDEQFVCAMHAHAGEIGRERLALAVELMAHGAIGRENFVTVGRVARLAHFRIQFGDERILLLHFRPAQFVDDFVSVLRDRAVRVRTETVNGGGTQRRQ